MDGQTVSALINGVVAVIGGVIGFFIAKANRRDDAQNQMQLAALQAELGLKTQLIVSRDPAVREQRAEQVRTFIQKAKA